MRASTTLTIALAAAIAVSTLSGCAAATGPEPETDGWASAFKDAYNQATYPFVRGVLEDGVITDQEHSEMWERFVSCMSSAGITVTETGGGAYSYDFPESLGSKAAHEQDSQCSTQSGEYPIGALYAWVARNPDNLDENEIMAACLVRVDAVAEGYTAEDFARDNQTQGYPFLDKTLGPLAIVDCAADPLGLLE